MRLGILGSGQLGMMLAAAARRLDVEPTLYSPRTGPTSDVVREAVHAPWEDLEAVARFARGVDVCTYELEQLPLETARQAAEVTQVCPPPEALERMQDRLEERALLASLGIPMAPHVAVRAEADLDDAAREVGFPLVLKRAQGGYDGKSQARVKNAEELRNAFQVLNGPCLAERMLSLRREVSLIAVRGQDGALRCYDPVENVHREGILRLSRAPALMEEHQLEQLHDIARAVAEALSYVGVLTVELFETDEGLFVNELAPRVHNSGHWTIEGAETSQFENHVRAVCGLPLGSTTRRGASAMVNVIGERPAGLRELLSVPGAALHLYGKTPAHGRKLGHVTVTAPDDEALEERLTKVVALVDGSVQP